MGWGVHDYPEPPDDKPEDYPHCPVCQRLCDTVIFKDGEPVGCDICTVSRDAWDCPECFPGNE